MIDSNEPGSLKVWVYCDVPVKWVEIKPCRYTWENTVLSGVRTITFVGVWDVCSNDITLHIP